MRTYAAPRRTEYQLHKEGQSQQALISDTCILHIKEAGLAVYNDDGNIDMDKTLIHANAMLEKDHTITFVCKPKFPIVVTESLFKILMESMQHAAMLSVMHYFKTHPDVISAFHQVQQPFHLELELDGECISEHDNTFDIDFRDPDQLEKDNFKILLCINSVLPIEYESLQDIAAMFQRISNTGFKAFTLHSLGRTSINRFGPRVREELHLLNHPTPHQ